MDDSYWFNFWLPVILTCFISYIYNFTKKQVFSGKLWYFLTCNAAVFEVIDIFTDFNYLLFEIHISFWVTFVCTICLLVYPLIALYGALIDEESSCYRIKLFFKMYFGFPDGMKDDKGLNDTIVVTKGGITLTENCFLPFFVLYDALNVGGSFSWLTCLTIATSLFGVFNNLSHIISMTRKNSKEDCWDCSFFYSSIVA